MAFLSSMMTGNAVADLGLGGQLANDVTAQTEEERKKRMAQMQQAKLMGPAGSLAVSSLFGMRGTAGGIGGGSGAGY